MPKKAEKPEATELITIGGERLPNLERLKPQHFELLDGIMNRLYHYQYRHVAQVTWMKLAGWSVATVLIKLFDLVYIQSLGWKNVLGYLLGFTLLTALAIGLLCIFSRCFTRLFHFKISSLRVSQFLVGLLLFDYFTPHLLVLNNYITGIEGALFASRYLLVMALAYGAVDALITFKWLRAARRFYIALVLFLFLLLLFFDEVQHYVFKDNEVMVYSNSGGKAATSIDVIDSVIDQTVKDVE